MEETKLNTIFLETQTIFRKDGDISIYPHECELGSGKEVTSEEVRYRGSINVHPDGTTNIRAYQASGRHTYETLYRTKLTRLRVTNKQVVLDVKLPKGLGKQKITEMISEEFGLIQDYLTLADTRLD